jgi:hypothetical protein
LFAGQPVKGGHLGGCPCGYVAYWPFDMVVYREN